MSDEDDTKPEVKPNRHGSPELQAFRKEVKEQLGNQSAVSFVEQYPGVHIWATYRDVISCAFCGACKQRDPTKNGTCRGLAKVELRDV
jgi:hypothetical protein